MKFVPDDMEPIFFAGNSKWKQTGINPEKYLGKEVKVGLVLDEKKIIDHSIIFPTPLNPSISNAEQSSELVHYVEADRNKIELSWNTTVGNNVGNILVVMRFEGYTSDDILGKKYEPFTKLFLLEDDGYQKLSQELFQGIPTKGLVSFEFLRGYWDDSFKALDDNNFNIRIFSTSLLYTILE